MCWGSWTSYVHIGDVNGDSFPELGVARQLVAELRHDKCRVARWFALASSRERESS